MTLFGSLAAKFTFSLHSKCIYVPYLRALWCPVAYFHISANDSIYSVPQWSDIILSIPSTITSNRPPPPQGDWLLRNEGGKAGSHDAGRLSAGDADCQPQGLHQGQLEEGQQRHPRDQREGAGRRQERSARSSRRGEQEWGGSVMWRLGANEWEEVTL